MVNMLKLQIGKQGLTKGFIEDLKRAFENVENIRISVLSSASRDKTELKEMTDEIIDALGPRFTAKTIGYTIVVKKWRRARK